MPCCQGWARMHHLQNNSPKHLSSGSCKQCSMGRNSCAQRSQSEHPAKLVLPLSRLLKFHMYKCWSGERLTRHAVPSLYRTAA